MAKAEKDKKDPKNINVETVVSYLNHSFAKKIEEVFGNKAKAVKGTELYKAQVEFCYLIDEIQRGPSYILPKAISDANEFIASLERKEEVSDEAA